MPQRRKRRQAQASADKPQKPPSGLEILSNLTDQLLGMAKDKEMRTALYEPYSRCGDVGPNLWLATQLTTALMAVALEIREGQERREALRMLTREPDLSGGGPQS